jgi:hypothetical protein
MGLILLIDIMYIIGRLFTPQTELTRRGRNPIDPLALGRQIVLALGYLEGLQGDLH